MVTLDALVANFYPVEDLGGGLVRCSDELPKTTFHTYFKLTGNDDVAPFVVSQDRIDDAFAALVLTAAGHQAVDTLTKTRLPPNGYGFTHLLRAPHAYHAHLKGRLDGERPRTTLCIPIFDAEFSGSETPRDFDTLTKSVVPTTDWAREPAPKIALRFDNTRTKGGTGDGYVLARLDLVLREIDNLVGVPDGFIEILNHRDEVVEILFESGQTFTWISGRDDKAAEPVAKDALRDRLRAFLTR
jgi:hypothetical protein